MAGVRNLRQAEAIKRSQLLAVSAYTINLDLSDVRSTDCPTFRSTTTVEFDCHEPGKETFIEVAAHQLQSAALNGIPLDLSSWNADQGLTLSPLAKHNTLVVNADYLYSTSGQGLHRLIDPVDGETYIYSQFETADAQRVFACFDQPDLKAEFTWIVTVPDHWAAISNMPVDKIDHENTGVKTFTFTRAPRMSTYITAICAGPYHKACDSHDGIDLGVYCRKSMCQYLDSDDIFLVTKQGFDFFHDKFGIRYPLPKYDQIFIPEFNAGAMENFGCVVHAEDHYLFRSPVTAFEYEQRANTILHEMAHMWFGNLVTMRWWDDLWLNESFAEWASHWCNVNATRFTEAWTTFLSMRKAWGYRQDQLSSTHPVYCDMPDVESVEVNFDGITYAKGASIVKQLVAYVGEEDFLAGLRVYFTDNLWANATFDDLLEALEAASGKPLRDFATQWLKTSQINTLHPHIAMTEDGTYSHVAIRQEAPESHPTLRTHKINIGLYDLCGEKLIRRDILDVNVTNRETPIPELAGVRAADVILLNDSDLTYAKIRLDQRSLETIVAHIEGFENSLTRGLCWSAAWDMVRDGEMATRDYIQLVTRGIRKEKDINLVTSILRQAKSALTFYADPTWVARGWAHMAITAKQALEETTPGSEFQIIWARAFATTARTNADVDLLARWLRQEDVPPQLKIQTDLRWTLIHALIAEGAMDKELIESELDNDRTATGERQATVARALVPDATAKSDVWRLLTQENQLPNWQQRALLEGFHHPSQVALTAPYARNYFDVLDRIWSSRDSEQAQDFVHYAYPAHDIRNETLTLTDDWLTKPAHPTPLRRLVTEGRDGIVRALKARAKDAS